MEISRNHGFAATAWVRTPARQRELSSYSARKLGGCRRFLGLDPNLDRL
jgi:hypothetical protein